MKDTETLVAKLIEKALRHYEMIQPGEKILIGLSGGKDSTTLARDLAVKRRWWDVPFELGAAHIASDLPGQGDGGRVAMGVEKLAHDLDIPFERIDVPVLGRLKEGEKMSCYWCATMRRTELMRHAEAKGYTAIALGHHMDDILETLLMNMLRKGEFATMPPVMRYLKYPLKVIRPLALLEERTIVEYAREAGFMSSTCTCTFNLQGERKKTRAKLESLTGGSSLAKRNLFASMSTIKKEYLA